MTLARWQRTVVAGTVTALLFGAGAGVLAKNKHDGSATGAPKARGHHCEAQGVEIDKAKKDCRKAGGVWMDGAPHVTAQPTAPPPTR
jgi:hypothetical protein